MSSDTARSPAGALSGAATTARLRSPVRVAVIDVSEPLCDVDCTRPLEPPYTGAWILVCNSGHALGSIEIPVVGTLITAAELKHELHRQLGKTWSSVDLGAAFPLSTKISVVIPCNFARPGQLRHCVERLTELDYPDYEVIVVDNRPGNVPPVDIRGVRVVREPQPGISAARNRGIEVATGEIIAFTDDDVVADRRWLRALAERFAREPDVAAVTGVIVPLELETTAQVLFEQSRCGRDRRFNPLTFERFGRFRVLRRAPENGTEQVGSLYRTGEFGPGANMAFRAAVLREMGGFDEALGTGTPTCGGEDLAILVELLTAGHRLAYEPGAIIQHRQHATLAELEHQVHGYGIGFTAMLTAVTLRNPWHIIGLAEVLPAWLRSLRDPSSTTRVNRAEEYPLSLARAELRGMLAGPLAYLRSCWVHRAGRRWPS
jgi:GT2 family glycosyltransferase